ncbi:MAG: hypothetical protein P4M11_07650 [Candidatus Pacebacteria bacterium]|nr:hypothetical protein [Candidatus Paceibacterota bacterium]
MGTIALTVRIKSKFSQKWMYSFLFPYSILLVVDYFMEIATSILNLYNKEAIFVLRMISILALHSAFLIIMYSVTVSTKYILILTRRLALYRVILLSIIVATMGVGCYAGILVWFEMGDIGGAERDYYTGTIVFVLCAIYTGIMLSSLLIKSWYEEKKYYKRKAYYWSIVFYFLIYAALDVIDVAVFRWDTEEKYLFDSIANIVVDALPMYCAIYFAKSARREHKKRPGVLMSFFVHPERTQNVAAAHQDIVVIQ